MEGLALCAQVPLRIVRSVRLVLLVWSAQAGLLTLIVRVALLVSSFIMEHVLLVLLQSTLNVSLALLRQHV